MILGIAHEIPMGVETPAVAVAQLGENDPADLADTGRHLEEVDEFLVGVLIRVVSGA